MILNVQGYVAEIVMSMVVEQDVMEQKKVNKDLGGFNEKRYNALFKQTTA